MGSAPAFAEVNESAALLTRNLRGLQTGEGGLSSVPAALQPALTALMPLVDRAEKNAAQVVAQEKTLTKAGKALQTQEVRDRLAGIGIEMISKGPDDFAAYLKGESARFAAIIKNGNIKLDP